MRAPVQLPRQEGPGESALEQQLGLLLSFDPGPDLAEHVVHVELGAVRAAGGPGLLAPAGPGQAPPGAPAKAATGTVGTGRTGVDGAVTTPADDGKPAEVRLRSVLAELGLDAGSVALLSSVATTLAAVRTGRPVAGLAATSTTRANRPTDDTGRDDDADADVGAAREGDGGESGVGAPDAAAVRRTGQGVLDRIEDLLDLSARLDGALLAAAGELTRTNARLLLAAKGRTDPAGLSPAARERWAARARSATAHELSAATGWGIGQARDLVAAATAPAAITTPVLSALGSSVVSWPLVRRAWRAATAAGLDVEATTHLAQVMFGTDPDQVAVERLTPTGTVSTLPWAHRAYHHALDREIAKLTAGTDHATRAARANARAARDATARLDDDGTATVTITTGPAQATALIDRLHTAARTARRHGDARTLAQLRADTACALLLHGTLPLPDQPGDPDQVTVQNITALAALLEGLPAATLNVITPWHLLPGTTGSDGSGGHEHPHRCSTTPCPAAPPPPPRPGQPDAPQDDPDGPDAPAGHQDRPPGAATPKDGPDDPAGPPEEPSDQGSPTVPVTGPPGDGQRQEVLLAVAQATGTTPAFLHAPDVADLLTTPGTTLHRLVIDPLDGRCVERSTTAYQPDAHMRAQAHAADGTCRAPGCTRPAIYTQLDHVHEHATGGATTLCNLECLCTTHHDLKTARHWHATIDAHRDVTWQTLLGRIYATRVHDHRAYTTLLATAIATVEHATTTATTAAAAAAAAQGAKGVGDGDDPDPATARAEAIDQAIYTALCHRAPTDSLPTADDEHPAPYDNPHHRPTPANPDATPGTPGTDQVFTADPATTLTHTDPHGRRRWGPPPTGPDPTTSADAPARPQPKGLPKLNIPTQPDNAPTPHDDPGHDDPGHDDTPWDKRTYGPPPF